MTAVTAGNDGAPAAGIALAATCSHLFVLTRLRTLVPTWPTEF